METFWSILGSLISILFVGGIVLFLVGHIDFFFAIAIPFAGIALIVVGAMEIGWPDILDYDVPKWADILMIVVGCVMLVGASKCKDL